MTTLEWAQVKKKLSVQENNCTQKLHAMGPGPNDRLVDEGEKPDYVKSDCGYVMTARGWVVQEIRDIQQTRANLKPRKGRW